MFCCCLFLLVFLLYVRCFSLWLLLFGCLFFCVGICSSFLCAWFGWLSFIFFVRFGLFPVAACFTYFVVSDIFLLLLQVVCCCVAAHWPLYRFVVWVPLLTAAVVRSLMLHLPVFCLVCRLLEVHKQTNKHTS